MQKETTLIKMKVGEEGKVARFELGEKPMRRLEALGIMAGKKIRKNGGSFWGPVTVSVGTTQISLGRGMASKVIVQVQE